MQIHTHTYIYELEIVISITSVNILFLLKLYRSSALIVLLKHAFGYICSRVTT